MEYNGNWETIKKTKSTAVLIDKRLLEQYNDDREREDDMDISAYDKETGLPTDRSYLECGLPLDLQESVREMEKSWKILDGGEKDYHWDIVWCNLNADINAAEVEQRISSEQAWYLREKYLRIKRDE